MFLSDSTNTITAPIAAPTAISIPDLAESAIYVDFHVGIPPFNKLDKNVSEEVDTQKNAKTRAGNYHKKLLGECQLYETIKKFAANSRNRIHYKYSKPWGDSGLRVTTADIYINEYEPRMSAAAQEFLPMVQEFLDEYDNIVSAAAFQLGDLFDRTEYPSRDRVASKFYFRYAPCPMNDSNDFRLKMGRDAVDLIKSHYRTHYEQCILDMQRDNWEQLHKVLTHMSDRLSVTGEDKTTFRDSLMRNALSACDLLKSFNLTKDPALEAARLKLEETLYGVTADALRDDLLLRSEVKSKVDSILKDMDW